MNNDDLFYKALVDKDVTFEGRFFVGVKTTGIFCRPTCRARKPKRENVEFFATAKEALMKGYRPCKVCHPLEKADSMPDYVSKVLRLLDEKPFMKLKDYHLRELNIQPSQLRRWFKINYGITFHAYQRMYRINYAYGKYREGKSVTDIAFESGYESLSGFNESFKKMFGISPSMGKKNKIMNLTRIETVLGTMVACASQNGICLLEFADRKMLETELKQLEKVSGAPLMQTDNKFFKPLIEQLDSYFDGQLQVFDLPLDEIGTEFQKKVWAELRKIPYGSTATYALQAQRIGQPTAVRAVANANGMNKIAIIIPCHRVIGSDGSLTGYAGGLWRKKKLLELESKDKSLFKF